MPAILNTKTIDWIVEKVGPHGLMIFTYLLPKADKNGVILVSERQLSKELSIPRTSLQRILSRATFGPLWDRELGQGVTTFRIKNWGHFSDTKESLGHRLGHLRARNGPPKEKGSSSPSSFPSPSDSPISINTPNTSKEKKIPSVSKVAQGQLSPVRIESSKRGNTLAPKTTPGVAEVVMAWKDISEVEDNGTWNKNNFARHVRPAKALIDQMGSVEGALECMKWTWSWLVDLERTCTLATVARHVDTYKRNKNKKEKVPWDQMDPSKITKKS